MCWRSAGPICHGATTLGLGESRGALCHRNMSSRSRAASPPMARNWTPLDEAALGAVAQHILAMGAEAVAICFLHAFANPAHERRALALLRAALPGLAVTASTEVLPVVREYERSMAAVLNGGGDAGGLHLYRPAGGAAGRGRDRRAPAADEIQWRCRGGRRHSPGAGANRPSGPAAGVVGARAACAAAGVRDLITVDIGGTSADIRLIADGRIGLTQFRARGPGPCLCRCWTW